MPCALNNLMNSKFSKKRLAISLTMVFMLTSLLVSAQVNRRDVVYLKNGSVIKGDILEVIPNETIKVKTSDGSTFVFKMDEVERTGKDESVKNEAPVDEKKDLDKTNEKLSPKSSGYLLMVRLGPNIHLLNTSSFDFSASIINGIQLNQYMSFGIGAEATTYVYDDYNSSVTIFPFFVDARFYIPRRIIQPMFSLQLGYSVVGNKKSNRDYSSGYYSYDFDPSNGDGGLFVGLNAGGRLQATKRMAVVVDGGLSLQKLNGSENGRSSSDDVPSFRGNIGVCWNFGSDKK